MNWRRDNSQKSYNIKEISIKLLLCIFDYFTVNKYRDCFFNIFVHSYYYVTSILFAVHNE